ncbi:hypothetical protein OC844_007945, partial [Tilletia horrida]
MPGCSEVCRLGLRDDVCAGESRSHSARGGVRDTASNAMPVRAWVRDPVAQGLVRYMGAK